MLRPVEAALDFELLLVTGGDYFIEYFTQPVMSITAYHISLRVGSLQLPTHIDLLTSYIAHFIQNQSTRKKRKCKIN